MDDFLFSSWIPCVDSLCFFHVSQCLFKTLLSFGGKSWEWFLITEILLLQQIITNISLVSCLAISWNAFELTANVVSAIGYSSYLLVSGIRSPYSEIWSFIFQVFSLTIQNLLNFGTCIILSDEYLLIWNSRVHQIGFYLLLFQSLINTRNWNGYLQADIARAVA